MADRNYIQNYIPIHCINNVDGYVHYRVPLEVADEYERLAELKASAKPPNPESVPDFQLYPRRLTTLVEQEVNYYQKCIGYKVPCTLEIGLEEQRALQQKINNSVPLTKKEKEEKAQLLQQGFPDWTVWDFKQFIYACAEYGRHSPEVLNAVDGKVPEEVSDYSKMFWERCKEFHDYEEIMRFIEDGEWKLLNNNTYETESVVSNGTTTRGHGPPIVYTTTETIEEVDNEQKRLKEIAERLNIKKINYCAEKIFCTLFTRTTGELRKVVIVQIKESCYIWVEQLYKVTKDEAALKNCDLRPFLNNPVGSTQITKLLGKLTNGKVKDLVLTSLRNFDRIGIIDPELGEVLEVLYFNWKNPGKEITLL